MNQESIAAIQHAGQVIQDAHAALVHEVGEYSALVHEVGEYSALVMQALAGDAFEASIDARYEQWKTVA